MKKKSPPEKPALDLMEEAVHLLRKAPAGVHLCYYTGSVPFVVALLHFWSDMCRGAYAYDRIGGSSLGVALLFVWMKCWHSVSASKLTAFLSGADQPRWTPGRVTRLVTAQTAFQPAALFARPAAFVITLPYGWVRAFFENLLILGDGSTAGLGTAWAKAKRQASLRPKQNHLALLILILFGMIVWLNLLVLLAAAPHLLKMLTGIGTAFTENPYSMFNTTFFAVSVACAYLCVNPLTRAVYVLRCFYGESLSSGDDLRLEMRRAAGMAVVMAALMFCPAAANAAPAGEQRAARVNATALDSSIEQVLKRDEFAWRMPRQEPPQQRENFVFRFIDDMMAVLRGWIKSVIHWIGDKWWRDFLEWLRNRHPPIDTGASSLDKLRDFLHDALWGLCALTGGLLVWLAWKNRRSFRRRAQAFAEPLAAVPDLNSEDVVASQLPEDAWLKLARDMVEKGDLRLAIRAMYLAMLAHLSLRELIAIARHKSNRDYERELNRRARTRDDLQSAFGESITLFEGAWYGTHETTSRTIQEFTGNIHRIRAA